ncbi:MAG: hypothetical protein LBH22_00525 [Bacteroidales bacterium]|jgi:hypothetical protein|nr:hypothetical protein [Bacteroidales bacterium]
MSKIIKIFALIAFLGIIILTESCRKDPVFNTDPSFRLEFSNDTIRFDTIFTSLGSTTLSLKVYNRSNKDIDIRTIQLMGKEASYFRITVDGDTSLFQRNVRLRAKDSLFIFIRVTIDPNNDANPLAIWDYIRFSYNNRSQDVVLSAFGQDAIFHHEIDGYFPYFDGTDTLYIPYTIADCSTPWTAGKPHVMFRYLLVQSGDELILEAGTRLHFAPDAGLIVDNGGSLKIRGEFGREVVFDGMRMDEAYRNTTGQWGRIWLFAGSINNEINWAIIRNGKIGLLVDSMANDDRTLTIENTIIDNMQSHGIWARNADILGNNLQVSNCGERLLELVGGRYAFEHCTFANYFRHLTSFRRTASVLLKNYTYSNSAEISLHPLMRADFTSCIIYGSRTEGELELDLKSETTDNYNFSYCNIRTRINTNSSRFQECQINIDPFFKNITPPNFDFDIAGPPSSQTSGVIGKGKPGSLISRDLKNRLRPWFSTIGAYEFTE